jgi:hypothetical protein
VLIISYHIERGRGRGQYEKQGRKEKGDLTVET